MKAGRMDGKSVVVILAAVLLAVCIAERFIANAGNLNPTAAPGPTMKTLDEVEPRIPIPGSATAAATFTISQQGSYYLTGDRYCSATGIQVNVDCVTIDLCGYTLHGPGINSGTDKCGIYMNGRENVEIKNGTIRTFGAYGIHEAHNTYGEGHRLSDLRLNYNRYQGAYLLGKGHTVENCTIAHNTGGGVRVMTSCILTGNNVYDNTNGNGIETSIGCIVKGNTCHNNAWSGISVYPSSVARENTCYDNGMAGINTGDNCTIVENAVHGNDYQGIYAGNGCTVRNNTAVNNQRDGIYAGISSVVTENTARYNNIDNSDNYGGIHVQSAILKTNVSYGNNKNNIRVFGGNSAIEENLVISSTNGIYFVSTGNFYANNRASDNVTNYAGSLPTGSGDGGGNVEF